MEYSKRYKTKFVDKINVLIDLINLADKNTYDELDCSLEVYKDYLLKTYQNQNIWSWVLYDLEKPIGYLIAVRNRYLWDDLEVTGLFILPEYQGNDLMGVLLEDMILMGINHKAKRIRWHSHVFQEKDWWQKRVSKFGGVVQEYKQFYCNLDGSSTKAFHDYHRKQK